MIFKLTFLSFHLIYFIEFAIFISCWKNNSEKEKIRKEKEKLKKQEASKMTDETSDCSKNSKNSLPTSKRVRQDVEYAMKFGDSNLRSKATHVAMANGWNDLL